MQSSVRFCVPAAARLAPFCRACQGLPGWRLSRWNSQRNCSPPPPRDNPRVLITGDASLLFIFQLLTHRSFGVAQCSNSLLMGIDAIDQQRFCCFAQAPIKRGKSSVIFTPIQSSVSNKMTEETGRRKLNLREDSYNWGISGFCRIIQTRVLLCFCFCVVCIVC